MTSGLGPFVTLETRTRINGWIGVSVCPAKLIHTTPDNEAETAAGQPVNLLDSHGCIHIKPLDRDVFQRRGAFANGNFLTIHSYKASLPRAWR